MIGWIVLALSLGAFWIAFTTESVVLLTVALIVGAVLLLVGFVMLLQARVGDTQRTQSLRETTLLVQARPKAPQPTSRSQTQAQSDASDARPTGIRTDSLRPPDAR